MLKKYLIVILFLLGTVAVNLFANSVTTIWSIGQEDRSAREFALAPNGFRHFVGHDFGYEDKYFIVGHSEVGKDFPYALPGPVDTWGGTWNTAGWRTHCVTVLFDLDREPHESGYELKLVLSDFSKEFLPLLKVSVNSQDFKCQLTAKGCDLSKQRKPTQNEEVKDTLSLSGNMTHATPKDITIPIENGVLHKGGNQIVITVLEGSWILFDNLLLRGMDRAEVKVPKQVFVRSVSGADYELSDCQPMIVDVEHLQGSPKLEVMLDGKTILSQRIEKGRYQLEAPMPRVRKAMTSHYKILCDGITVASGEVIRSPRRKQTWADYVDTRIGTAHSRWMIAPGPWMPFGMVKLSPDNQNKGWQAGYQPSIENVGCFSHIHEWTLAGLGIMPTNGPLKTKVGDEQKPDEGYRSRIDKRTEVANVGYYSVSLTDYGIKAELTATTRCGFERFTFPKDKGQGRVLIEFHPEAEYDFILKGVNVRAVSPTRIEGQIQQSSPGVWSYDADQEYNVNFVLEFDQPILSMDYWLNDSVKHDVSSIVSGQCSNAGLILNFDTEKHAVVQVRSAISPVSIANASDNLQKELSGPFGWNFAAVEKNQVDTWNDLFSRIQVKSNDRLEKSRFYNWVYRSLCGRNIWSDVNGEWISTDGIVRRVQDPSKDVMVSSDAYWNTFWNLNQFWNLITPEWSNKLVRSQLALYRANGWLGKGPAGLNYIPVMVAEHEIPMMVGAWQMGIRDYDGNEVLEAAVKMQTTQAQKVFKGFAGNRDLAAYMRHGYVPSDCGRFSNTMEYSFDDWTVGQLAKSLGEEKLYQQFNRRGYWWKNVIGEDGYCHLRDSNGVWMEDFDFFRSGANHQYVEGNAWQLTFFVPQDVPALVKMIGHKRFTDRLLWGFHQDEAWRYNAPNDQYWDHPIVQGNQQSMHFAFLFNYAGQPWNTQRWSRSILERYYGAAEGNAFLGDEDQGQMSAWAVMAALGLFQIDGGCAVNPTYEIASPLFEEVTINLGGKYGRGRQFVIKANNASRTNIYVQKAMLNGIRMSSFRFPVSELLKGGELELEMGNEPNKNFGIE